MIREVDDQTFERAILTGKVLVDFWAPWCGPCQMLAPILEEVAAELVDEVKIVKVNVDENPVTAEVHQIMSIPSLLLFVDGELQAKTAGVLPKEDVIDFIRQR